MFTFKKSILFLVAIFAVLLAGCQQNPKSPERKKEDGRGCNSRVLRINIASEPRTLDPARARDLQSLTLMRMLFEGLTRVNQEENVEPALAEKIDVSEDLKTYTFHLRASFWSNGERVTADDFVYTWKKILDPKSVAENASQLYVIKNALLCKEGKCPAEDVGVRALDEMTFQVELENPTPYFLELTSYPAFFAISAKLDRERPRWAEGKEDYIGNGPFTLKEWRHHDKLCVQKNERYWDSSAVQVQEIHLFMVKEESELAMFENGDLDWAGSPLSTLPIDALPKLRKTGALRSQPILGTYFFRLNTENPLLASAKLRRALSFSIDRQAIVEHVLLGSQMAAEGFVPSAMHLQEKSYFSTLSQEDLQALVNEGLQEAGLQKGDMANLELLYASTERNHRIAHAIQEQWMRLFGVQIKLFGVEQKVFFEKLNKGDFQMAAGSWMADFGDAFAFLEVFKNREATTNRTRWDDATYTQMLEASNITVDPVQRKTLLANCEKILLEAMPIIPLFHYNMLYVQNENVKNISISRMGGIDFRWARFAQNDERSTNAKTEASQL